MARKVIVEPRVSRALRACGLSREGLLRALNMVHYDLADDYPRHLGRRDPQQPDHFRYRRQMLDGNTLHEFDFGVDDSTSPDHLFVNGLDHRSRPLGG